MFLLLGLALLIANALPEGARYVIDSGIAALAGNNDRTPHARWRRFSGGHRGDWVIVVHAPCRPEVRKPARGGAVTTGEERLSETTDQDLLSESVGTDNATTGRPGCR